MVKLKKVFINIIENKKAGIGTQIIKTGLLAGSYLYYPLSFLAKTIAFGLRKKLPCAVISVGNITWGGTGKTPLIILLIREVLKRKKKIAVLMRGYGKDEDIFLRSLFPSINVISGKNRYKNGMKHLEKNKVDLFLLDDGFQQWGLQRDIDIVTVNCLNPWGNGFLIPRGSLREPPESLRRADFIILTNTNFISAGNKELIKQRISQYVPRENIIESIHQGKYFFRASNPHEHIALDNFKGRRALVFSGIASPESFKKTLEKIGVVIVEDIAYEDHHQFTNYDCEHIKKRCGSDINIITTEKDLMRNYSLLSKEINPFILRIELELEANNNAFINRLDGILGC